MIPLFSHILIKMIKMCCTVLSQILLKLKISILMYKNSYLKSIQEIKRLLWELNSQTIIKGCWALSKGKNLIHKTVNTPRILMMSIWGNQMVNTYLKTLQRAYWNGESFALGEKVE